MILFTESHIEKENYFYEHLINVVKKTNWNEGKLFINTYRGISNTSIPQRHVQDHRLQ